MRYSLAVVLIAAVSTSATAQTGMAGKRDGDARPSIGLPLGPIGLPLSPIGLPLSNIGLPLSPIGLPMAGFEQPTKDRRDADDRRRRDADRGRRQLPSLIYIVPAYGWDALAATGSARPGPAEKSAVAKAPAGRLRFELQPGVNPQVYIDNDYAGLVGDFVDGLPLEAGRYSLKLQQDGYQALELDLRVFSGRVTTYRGTLIPLTAVSPAIPSAPAPASTAPVYLIPGCYLGNVPPDSVELRPGCDPSRAVQIN